MQTLRAASLVCEEQEPVVVVINFCDSTLCYLLTNHLLKSIISTV